MGSGLIIRFFLFVSVLLALRLEQLSCETNTYHKPDEVQLNGVKRDFKFLTPFGNLRVRWQVASVEYFGKEPYFVVKEAWEEAAKTLFRRQFPAFLRSTRFDWNLVFMDEQATRRNYPFRNSDCHPAWIRPPADIYLSAFFIGTNCQQREPLPIDVARDRLKGTLYHEFGHAIEYQLIGEALRNSQRYHSEGFAEWFEVQALKDHGLVGYAREIEEGAKKQLFPSWNPALFDGRREDYYRAYGLIDALVKKRGLRGLLRIYADVNRNKIPFEQAVHNELGWTVNEWVKQAIILCS